MFNVFLRTAATVRLRTTIAGTDDFGNLGKCESDHFELYGPGRSSMYEPIFHRSNEPNIGTSRPCTRVANLVSRQYQLPAVHVPLLFLNATSLYSGIQTPAAQRNLA